MDKFAIPEDIAARIALVTPEQIAEAEAEEAATEKTQRRARRIELLQSTGTPRRVRDVLLAGARDTEPLLRVKEWASDPDPAQWAMVLCSTKGNGKSIAAGWWLGNSKAGAGSHGDKPLRRWWTPADLSLLDWYRGEFKAVAEMDGPLVIDDLGSEFSDGKGFFRQQFAALIDARYREYLPTLITTNLGRAELRDRYDERVADRLREGGAVFEFKAPSMRRKGE